jgi:hypothetical protein
VSVDGLVSVSGSGVEAPADWGNMRSPENYLGFARTKGLVSPGGDARLDRSQVYSSPARLALNQWALVGEWMVTRGLVALHAPNGRLHYRFHARDVHLVMGSGRQLLPVRFRVSLDGQPPGAAHGVDADAAGNGTVMEPRLYQLFRQPAPIALVSSKLSSSMPASRRSRSRSVDPPTPPRGPSTCQSRDSLVLPVRRTHRLVATVDYLWTKANSSQHAGVRRLGGPHQEWLRGGRVDASVRLRSVFGQHRVRRWVPR